MESKFIFADYDCFVYFNTNDKVIKNTFMYSQSLVFISRQSLIALMHCYKKELILNWLIIFSLQEKCHQNSFPIKNLIKF